MAALLPTNKKRKLTLSRFIVNHPCDLCDLSSTSGPVAWFAGAFDEPRPSRRSHGSPSNKVHGIGESPVPISCKSAEIVLPRNHLTANIAEWMTGSKAAVKFRL